VSVSGGGGGSAGGDRVRDLFRRAADAGSLGVIIFRGMGAILLAVASVLVTGLFTIADVVVRPLQALIGGVSGLIGSLFGGTILIIDTSAITTALSLGPGGRFAVGPLTFALGIASILLVFVAVNLYLSEPETGNFAIGLPFDIPTPFFQGPEEDNEEA
jgi:hypothetical protein